MNLANQKVAQFFQGDVIPLFHSSQQDEER